MNETTMSWQRSTFCGDTACVEVAPSGDAVLMRDGKNRHESPLRFTRAEWTDFLDSIEEGHYRDL